MLRLTLILFLIAAGYPACAQINRDLDPKNPDLRLLERRTFDAVNMLRANRKTALLAWDDVLYRAAIDHAVYLIHEGKLSHEQRSRERATPSMRVKLHGGFVYGQVGENLASVTLGVEMTSKGKKLSTYSYSATATALAQLWKASPLHYRNLLQKGFNTSALALAYDPQSRRVVAVQVFGYAAELAGSKDQPDHSVELLRTPKRKLPFGLRHTDPQTKQNTRAIRAFLRLRGINGHLTGSYKVAKKAFKGRRAGLAVEWVPLAQFDSGAVEFDRVRNRRNGLHALNGELDRPVYRRQLLRYSRRASPRKVFLDLRIVRIYKREKKFIYPIGAGSGANIFLVHKKRLVTYTTPMGLPSDLLFAPLPELPFRNSFIVSDRKEKFFKQTRTDTLTVKVFYPAGEIDIDSTTSWKLVNDLNTIRGKVVKIDAYAFASIEGEMLANQELARQRANTFMAVVKPFLDTVTVVPTLSSKEQWQLFQRQIEAHKLSHLSKLDKRELRRYVNTHTNDSVISRLLDEQRFTLFKMQVRRDSLIALPSLSALEAYYNKRQSFEASADNPASEVSGLEDAQLRAYGEIISNRKSDTLPIVYDERYPVFRYHNLTFNYTVRGNISDQLFYHQLRTFRETKYFPGRLRSQLVYNNLALIYRNYFGVNQLSSMLDTTKFSCTAYRKSEFLLRKLKRISCRRGERDDMSAYYALKEFPRFLSLARTQNIPQVVIDSMQRFYTTSMINTLYGPILPKEIFQHVSRIKALYHPDDNKLTMDERTKLAFFYSAFDELETARNLLKPVADHRDLDPEARKLYITLQLDVYKDRHEFIKYLISQYSLLGNHQWCGIWKEGRFMNHLLLEDLTLKKFYNCNCR